MAHGDQRADAPRKHNGGIPRICGQPYQAVHRQENADLGNHNRHPKALQQAQKRGANRLSRKVRRRTRRLNRSIGAHASARSDGRCSEGRADPVQSDRSRDDPEERENRENDPSRIADRNLHAGTRGRRDMARLLLHGDHDRHAPR